MMYTFAVVFFVVIVEVIFSTSLNDQFQTLFNRDDIHCPDYCSREEGGFIHKIQCCTCSAQPVWAKIGILSIDKYGNLTTSIGNSIYSVSHRNGNLLDIPSNICQFKNVVYVDFSFNRIRDVSVLKCLPDIDTLYLRANAIEHFSKDMFLRMKCLRVLDLSFNRIGYIEPSFLFNMQGSLFKFDVSYNELTSLDITNLLWTKQKAFCFSDFSNNKISSVTNTENWACQWNTNFGYGGMVNVTFNLLTSILDFKTYGFGNILLLGKLMGYGFDFRFNMFNKLRCDCTLYPLVSSSGIFLHKVQRDYFEVRCDSPEQLKGVKITELASKYMLDRLVCNVSMADRCPPRCHCFYQPNQHRTVVNCSNTGKIKLPSALPERHNLHVDFANNKIALNNRCNLTSCDFTFLHQAQKLNLRNNRIKYIHSDFFSQLENSTWIDLRQNEIKQFPRELQAFHPCQVSLGVIKMICNCENAWLKNWLPKQNDSCFNNTIVLCHFHKTFKSIIEVTDVDLKCPFYRHEHNSKHYVIICSSVVVLILVTFVLFKTQVYLILITRKIRTIFRKNVNFSSIYTYDVYISCDENDESLRNWIRTSLVPYLENHSIRIFLPFRDCSIGGSRAEELAEVMSLSRNYILILSERYDGAVQVWIEHEWKYAWHNYVFDLNREITIVNYDLLVGRDISNKYIRAFLRLGHFIDFSNKKQRINENIYDNMKIT